MKLCQNSLIFKACSDRAVGTQRAPTSGGQYHWVSEFAPPEYQKVASYAAGLFSSIYYYRIASISELSVGQAGCRH